MKFIRLIKPNNTAYKSILKLGCGPNFVANRLDSFKLMIQEQGILFWFRFWFMSCNYPGWDIVTLIKGNWPTLSAKAQISVHNKFLKGSHEDATQFCLYAIEHLRYTKCEIEMNQERNENFKKLVNKCVLMSFGASMCVIFYKWLNIKEKCYDSTKSYWSTPEKYLDPNNKPETLEKLLVKEWHDTILPLIDIHLDNLVQVPWLLQLLYIQDKIDVLEEEDVYPFYALKVEETMRVHINQFRMHIHNADESRAQNIKIENEIVHFRNTNKTHKRKKKQFRRFCSYCEIEEDMHLLLKDCQRCLIENRKEPNKYCSVTCQLEHWFREHYKEHLVLKK